MRGCTPGLVTRWLWFQFPEHRLPEVDDIAVRTSTGSCWRIVSVKPSRKGGRWYSIRVEGLGIGAAEPGDDGTFTIVHLDHADHEAIRIYEQLEHEGIDVDGATPRAKQQNGR